MNKLNRCPHCGRTNGYYIKGRYSGTWEMRYGFDGKQEPSYEMYDGAQHTYGKYAYCQVCDKRLFRVEEAPHD